MDNSSTASQNQHIKVAGKYGLIGGVIIILGIVILYYIGRHPLLLSILFDFRIIIFGLFIFFSIKEFKDRYNSGELRFWQGMSIGLIVYMLMALIASVFIWIFGGWIQVNFVEQFIQLSIEQLNMQKDVLTETIGEERFNAALEALPQTSALDLSFDYFLKSIPIGLFLTLIISILLRSQIKPTNYGRK